MDDYLNVRKTNGSRHRLQEAMIIARRTNYDGIYLENGDASESYLYKTAKGDYFELYTDPDTGCEIVTPLNLQDAISFFEDTSTEKEMDFQQAFPFMEENLTNKTSHHGF